MSVSLLLILLFFVGSIKCNSRPFNCLIANRSRTLFKLAESVQYTLVESEKSCFCSNKSSKENYNLLEPDSSLDFLVSQEDEDKNLHW